HAGVHVITPLDVLNEAPAGSAGETDHVSGPAAHGDVVAEGVIVKRLVSTTVCGSAIAATDTVPTRCVTWISNGLLAPTSPVTAVAVSVNGPYVFAVPHAGVHVITPLDVLNEAPAGSAGETDQVSGPAAHGVVVAEGVIVSRLVSTTVCGS